ncbi:MAG: LPS export ABC transporter periplasmic protein LptC [Pseudomonadota bacterium]
MTTRRIALFILIALAIASGWLLKPTSNETLQTQQRELSDGYYLLDATISDTDENGQLVYSLQADRIDHVPDDGSVILNGLNVLYTSDASSTWTIAAERGTMSAARESLDLNGGVTIRSDPEQNTAVSTEQLTLDMINNEARTDRQVTVDLRGGRLVAQGMRADLKSKQIDLLSNVRGSFEATP